MNLQAQGINLGNVVCLGDSITEGKNGDVSPGTGGGLTGGYRQYLQNDLSNFNYSCEFVGQEDSPNGPSTNDTPYSAGMTDPNHEGYGSFTIDDIINGATVEGHTSQPIATLLSNDALSSNMPSNDTDYNLPGVVLLMIGTNDMLQGIDTSNAPARLSTLVGDIVNADPGVTLYVSNILPVNPNGSQNGITTQATLANIQAYDAAIPGVVVSYAAQGYNVKFVDQYSTTNAVTQTSDGIHPTYVAYQQIAQTWFQAIDENNRGLTTYVNTSAVTFNSTKAWPYGSIFVNSFDTNANTSLEASTAYFQSDSGTNFPNLFVSVDAGTVYFQSTQHLASLSIGTGGTVVATPSANGGRSVIYVDQYFVDNGIIDLTDNALDVKGGNLAAISSLVQQSYNNGNWNGSTGITSSTAAADTAHLTAVGVILNNVSGAAIYGSAAPLGLFDGSNPSTSDVLVKYTYYGDANLDGKVDGSDYSRIDNGYLNHLTGWYNGDFNYDGVVDGSDYTLIDNAFNTQGAQLADEVVDPAAVSTTRIGITSSSAVPEPSLPGIVTLAIATVLRRRNRSFR